MPAGIARLQRPLVPQRPDPPFRPKALFSRELMARIITLISVNKHTYTRRVDTNSRRLNDPIMSTLTNRIRAAREKAGLSQTDVAKALGISASAVNQWEHGFSKNIKLQHFFALARLLGQDPQWLATGKTHTQGRQVSAMTPAPDYPSPTGDEKALLHYVRQMPNALRKVVLRFLRGLSNVCTSHDQPGH